MANRREKTLRILPKDPTTTYQPTGRCGRHKASWIQGLAPTAVPAHIAICATKAGETPTRLGMGLSLNPRVVVPIHFPCAIRGDPYTCGWGDSTGGHRSRTRSQRLNLARAAARLAGKLTATAATGVRFPVVRCAAWQSEPRGDFPSVAAADQDLIRAGRCFRRESGGTDLSPSHDK